MLIQKTWDSLIGSVTTKKIRAFIRKLGILYLIHVVRFNGRELQSSGLEYNHLSRAGVK